MTDSPFISAATTETFASLVVEASKQCPVLVDFWADWCAPCHALMPVLAKLAEAYQGKFRLVKVNSDEQQELAMQFNVRSLPTVKIFRDGTVVDEFMGALPESAVREYIERHIVHISDTLRRRARELIEAKDSDAALDLLEKAVEADPELPENHVELAALHAAMGNLDQADQLLDGLDRIARERDDVIQLRKRIKYDRQSAESAPAEELEKKIAADDSDLQARFDLAAHYMAAEHFEEAMEQYLEIMKRDRSFGDDAGRKSLLDAFNLLGNNHPLVNEYRRKMTLLLY